LIDANFFSEQAAQRELLAKCGTHMDTWIVARKPIGMYKPPILKPSPTSPEVRFPPSANKINV